MHQENQKAKKIAFINIIFMIIISMTVLLISFSTLKTFDNEIIQINKNVAPESLKDALISISNINVSLRSMFKSANIIIVLVALYSALVNLRLTIILGKNDESHKP